MCSPAVLKDVRRELSRRAFFAAGGGVTVASMFEATIEDLGAQQKPVRMPGGFRDVFDLTHTFSPSLPVYSAYRPIQIKPRFTIEKDGFNANEVSFDEHTGTHLDAPVHFVAGAPTADRLPVARLIAPLAVVSIAPRASGNPDTLVEVDDILAWEKQHGRLPAGAFVAMHSGWDLKNLAHAAGFSEAAANFLVKSRDIVGAGVDTLSLDAAIAKKFVAHVAFLGAGKYGVEMLANLATVPPSGATIVLGAPKHQGATGGPLRALALA